MEYTHYKCKNKYENIDFINICKIFKIISGQFHFHQIIYYEDQETLTIKLQLFMYFSPAATD